MPKAKMIKKSKEMFIKPIALAIAVALGNSVLTFPAAADCFGATSSPSCLAIIPTGSNTVFVTNTLDVDPNIQGVAPIPEGSLRDAMDCANANPSIDTIKFQLPNATVPIITLERNYPCEAYLNISSDVTITGPEFEDPSGITIQGNGFDPTINNHRIFQSYASLTLENLTLQKGISPIQSGGAIFISPSSPITVIPTLTLNHTLLTNNQTKAGNGGAVFARNTHVVVNDSTISNNVANGSNTGEGNGGGIHSGGFPVTLTNSTVSNNSTTGDSSKGGGIFAFSDVSLTSSTVSGNTTVGEFSGGGGIYSSSQIILDDSTISGNKTTGLNSPGGGINAFNLVTIKNKSFVTENSTSGNSSPGGGIYEKVDLVDISQSTVSGNSTSGTESPGGGIHIEVGTDGTSGAGRSSIRQSTISGNTTTGDGSSGGGFNSKRGGVNIYNSTFSFNSTEGGNFYYINPSYPSYNRTVSTDGGGISATALKLSQSTLSGNHVDHASSSGGGALIAGVKKGDGQSGYHEGPSEIIQSTITGNFQANDGNGGISILAQENDTVIKNSIISDNFLSSLSFYSPASSASSKISFSNSLIQEPQSYFTSVIGSLTGMAGKFGVSDPKLKALTDNGGPTLTHLPDTGSPAIDQGDYANSPFQLDQRGTGFTRKVGTEVDIGSVESNITTPSVIPAQCEITP